jgi:hypothetical protein
VERFWLDLTCGLGLGVGAGYAFWCVLRIFSLKVSSDQVPNAQVWHSLEARCARPFLPPALPLTPLVAVQRQEEFYLKLEQARAQNQ